MYTYRVILLFVFAMFLFSPIVIDWWLGSDGAWYRPYAIWAVLLGISFGLQRLQDRYEL